MSAIERTEGLKENEYWLPPDGPPEWQALNQQYDEVLDRRIEDVMRELELDDLADLFRKDRQAFDVAIEQGRRAFFDKDDNRNAVARLVSQYEVEAGRAEAGQAPYAAIVMYGAACEARLLLMTLDFPEDVAQAIALLPPRFRPGSDPMR
jgi:hypothetical protein